MHCQQSCSSRNNSSDDTSGKVQQAALRRFQQSRHTAATDRRTAEQTHSIYRQQDKHTAATDRRTDTWHLQTVGQALLGSANGLPARRPTTHTETQTSAAEEKAATNTPQLPPQEPTHPAEPRTATAAASSPMATAPTNDHTRQPLPSPKRTVPDDIPEGSLPKQQRSTASASTRPARPEEATERPKTRMRITKVTMTTKQGTEKQSVIPVL